MYPFSTDRTIPELLGDALTELSKLIQAEFAIARLEMAEKVAAMFGAAKLIGIGAAIALCSLVIILMAIAAALMHAGLPDWAAYLITGIGAAIVGAAFVFAGLSRFSSRALTPEATLEQLRKDRLTAKAMTQ
jgi:uncharacterized membrane protein YqjE